jgi:hypothetical protein
MPPVGVVPPAPVPCYRRLRYRQLHLRAREISVRKLGRGSAQIASLRHAVARHSGDMHRIPHWSGIVP